MTIKNNQSLDIRKIRLAKCLLLFAIAVFSLGCSGESSDSVQMPSNPVAKPADLKLSTTSSGTGTDNTKVEQKSNQITF